MAENRLDEAFRQGLDLPDGVDLATLRFEDHPHWDSLGHMSLVVALEEAFGVELSEDEVVGMDSYPAAVALLESKGVTTR